MKNFFNRYKITTAVILYILALVALFYWLMQPLFFQIQSKNDKIQEVITRQESKTKRLQDLAKLRSQYEMTVDKEKNLILLFDKNQAVELIKELEEIAAVTGNKIIIEIKEEAESVQSKKGKRENDEKKDIKENLPSDNFLTFNISLSGNYAQAISFIKKLENMEYYNDILAVNIELDADKEEAQFGVSRSSGTNPVDRPTPTSSQESKLKTNIKVAVYVED